MVINKIIIEDTKVVLSYIEKLEEGEKLEFNCCIFLDCIFNDVDLSGIIFIHCKFYDKVEFSRCKLNNCKFDDCFFNQLMMYKCGCCDSEFINIITSANKINSLKDCKFNGSSFHFCNFNQGYFEDCNLEAIDCFNTLFHSCDINNCRFCHSIIGEFSQFIFCDLNLNDFTGCVIKYTLFIKGDINENNEFDDLSFLPMLCPSEGSFIGYKACRDGIIVKLLIPEDAKRLSGFSNKCRCDKAVVLSMEYLDGREYKGDEAYSSFDESFKYKVGETVSVSNFNENRKSTCSCGIHFFMTKDEAKKYYNDMM